MAVENGDRTLAVDLALLAGIPAVLVLVHVAVPSGGETLAFDHSTVDPLRTWTAAYVHLDDAHLRENLLGYGIAVLPLYTLYRTWGRRREFWTAVAVLLAVGPWVIAAGDYVAYRYVVPLDGVVTRGFSGIVGGLAGLLWASVPAYVADEYGRWRAVRVGMVALLVPLVALLANLSGLSVPTAAVVAIGLGAALANVVPRELWSDPAGLWASVRAEWLAVATVGYCVIAVALLLVNLFPAMLVDGGGVTNVFAHGIGLCFGSLVPSTVTINKTSLSDPP